MKFLFRMIALLFFTCSLSLHAAPKVIVTVSPIYALTQGIMQGIAEPTLLIAPGASPHSYALKPSQVSALNSADLVIWVGESLETFLIKTISQLPKNTHTLELLKTPGLDPLHFRLGRTWEQETDEVHTHNGFDPHVWLDPIRAQILVSVISQALSNIDPDNKNHYQNNATQINKQLSQLDQQLSKDLTPVKNKPFIVFHDAYQYFEKRYQLTAVGAITLNPEIMPSAQHLKAIQDLIKQKNVVCIFAEPQFKPAIVDMITQGTGVHEGVLDPLSTKGHGFAAYKALLTALSTSLRTCLAP